MRKGQISIFIIVGLLIVLLVAGIIILRDAFIQADTDVVSEVAALTPIEQFVQECLQRTTDDALFFAGTQGGYITLPDELALNTRHHISVNPASPIKTPLWAYGQSVYAPDIEVMQDQFEEYIDENILVCMNNFSQIEDIVPISAISEPKSTVQFNREDISITLDFVIQYASQTQVQEQNTFTYTHDLPLREMIETATLLINDLTQQTFFEQMTMDLFSAAEPEIPLSNMIFECGTKTWSKSDVTKRLSDILYYNIPRVRVEGALTTPFLYEDSVYQQYDGITPDDFIDNPDLWAGAPEDIYEFQHLYLRTNLAQRFMDEDITIGFGYYPEYGLELEARPSDGDRMEASSGQGEQDFLKFFCMQVYHFTYDIEYPIQVNMVKDGGLSDDRPFILRFAVPVQIRYNQPDKTASSFSLSLPTRRNGQFCVDEREDPIQIQVRNKLTGEGVRDADVQFQCHTYLCDLGKTQNILNGITALQTFLPQGCYGGQLLVSKEGYLDEKVPVDQEDQSTSIDLTPLKEFPVIVHFGAKDDPLVQNNLPLHMQAVIRLEDQFTDYEYSTTYTNSLKTLSEPTDPEELRNLYNQGLLATMKLPEASSVYDLSVIIYEDNLIVGGYVGEIDIDASDLSKRLNVYALNMLPHDGSTQESVDNWLFLTNETEQAVYSQRFGPEFR